MIKKLLALLFLASPLLAVTDRMGLNEPSFQTPRWDVPLNENWEIIDSSVALLSSSNTFTGSTTFTIGNFDSVKISTTNYSGTEKLVVNGNVKFFGPAAGNLSLCNSVGTVCGTFSSGGGPAYLTLPNTLGTSNVILRSDGATQPTLQLVASVVGGVAAVDGSNVPIVLSADRFMVGPTFGDRISNAVEPTGDRSAFEEPVYIGTHTITSAPMLGVQGSASSPYSVLIGTSPTMGAANYHLSITTGGVVDVAGSLTVAGSAVCRANGTNCPAAGGGGSSVLAVTTGTSSGVTGPPFISSPTTILSYNRDQLSVTLQAASTAFIQLQASSVTLQGNTFNVASKLLLLDSSARYPALDGSLITGISATGIYPATATASFPFGFSASTITLTGAGAGHMVFTNGLATSVTGVGAGVTALWGDSTDNWLKFNPNNTSTYTVVGTSTTNTAGSVPEWGTAGTLVNGDGNVFFSSAVRVGPIGTIGQTNNLIVSGNTLLSDNGATTVSTATLNVFAHTPSGTGTSILKIGTDQQTNQIHHQDRVGTTFLYTLNVTTITATQAIDFASKTLAELQGLAPSSAGQTFYCSNCTVDGVVVATGTAVGAWGRISARTTAIQ